MDRWIDRYFYYPSGISVSDLFTLLPFLRYDRNKLTLKDIHNCQYVACMNPTAGSFTIDSRLQVYALKASVF